VKEALGRLRVREKAAVMVEQKLLRTLKALLTAGGKTSQIIPLLKMKQNFCKPNW